MHVFVLFCFADTEMKKKSTDAKLNPGYNSSLSPGGFFDRQLIQRVEQASRSLLDDGP